MSRMPFSHVHLPLTLCVALLATLLGSSPQCSQAEEKRSIEKTATRPRQPKKSSKPKQPITVSKETTRILEPLDEEGFVDYLAAINQSGSAGVTPENNAAVLFVQAFGVRDFKPPERERFFELLQIDALPEEGDYFTEFGPFVSKKLERPHTGEDLADHDKAMLAPWEATDFPLVAEWLESNTHALDLVVEGTRRTQCYFPTVLAEHAPPSTALLPGLLPALHVAKALVVRAMGRIKDGKIREAEQDLLACHRLSRLIGKASFLITSLVCIDIDKLAYRAEGCLIEQGHLSAAEAGAYQQELCRLLSLPIVANEFDTSERFMILGSISLLVRQQVTLSRLVDPDDNTGDSQILDGFVTKIARAQADEVLRFTNGEIDKMVEAARKPTVPDRQRSLAVREHEVQAMKSEVAAAAKSPGIFLQALFPDKKMGRQVGKFLVIMLRPNLSHACEAENRGRTREVLGLLGFALAAYRADHGEYPETLDVLAPKYITEISKDPYTEQPLKYKKRADGFLLYSVGTNGKDDDGVTYYSQPSGDDIIVDVTHENARKP